MYSHLKEIEYAVFEDRTMNVVNFIFYLLREDYRLTGVTFARTSPQAQVFQHHSARMSL